MLPAQALAAVLSHSRALYRKSYSIHTALNGPIVYSPFRTLWQSRFLTGQCAFRLPVCRSIHPVISPHSPSFSNLYCSYLISPVFFLSQTVHISYNNYLFPIEDACDKIECFRSTKSSAHVKDILFFNSLKLRAFKMKNIKANTYFYKKPLRTPTPSSTDIRAGLRRVFL